VSDLTRHRHNHHHHHQDQVFSGFCPNNLGRLYLKYGHDRFLPHPFQFITRYYPTIWR
jgi:hypothetical protein